MGERSGGGVSAWIRERSRPAVLDKATDLDEVVNAVRRLKERETQP